jgi:hypothetical protein
VPGSLDKKGGRRCHLLLNKRWNLLPSFLFNEPGADLVRIQMRDTVKISECGVYAKLSAKFVSIRSMIQAQ